MKFKGIIFDLDGTLVDSLEDIAESMNKVLISCGFGSHDLQAYKYFIGNGIKNLVREALPNESREEKLVSMCFDSMMEEYRGRCTVKTRPYDGVSELLEELSTQNIRLAVFSNKVDELTKKVVSTFFPTTNFEVVIGARPDRPRKPSPEGAFLISERLRISPSELLYLGDTGVDMQTATHAKMYAVGALWGYRTAEELISNGAKSLINHPLDLLNTLDVKPA